MKNSTRVKMIRIMAVASDVLMTASVIGAAIVVSLAFAFNNDRKLYERDEMIGEYVLYQDDRIAELSDQVDYLMGQYNQSHSPKLERPKSIVVYEVKDC